MTKTTVNNKHQTTSRKSDLDKFKLYFETDIQTRDIRRNLRQLGGAD